ncbi:PREDICTED: two-component response regulator-like APRR9 isoform X2 [Prunus mume]|uniref:Two-component response regulator-like APRR9 isoform X2 n=1 Tax=Prunus mume TaxID=102107 RepID=A0ABM0PWG9_PRUMU|nr:PREDICTED: two-component response regulator-like APRR9 isoform X2 [Prunus mume]
MKMGEFVVSEDMETVKNEKNMEEEESGGVGSGSAEVVSWGSYLPKMVLRVLLIEADDSTRQIISALLRKCNYRVVAVGDGLKAWEVIKGKHHKIDLILTEAELPSISGFALLTLIMEHDMCKNIPVIMMSSQDAVSTVLKCMLKGAADYLIKPVRRNELRNLWQHVWRRQTIGVPQHKAEATSENNAASKHSNDYAVSMRGNKECSEKGSEAQDISQLKYGSASNLSNTDMERLEECARLAKESVMHESESKEKSGTFGSDDAPLNGHTSTAIRLREDHASAIKMVEGEGILPESYKGNANISSETHSCSYELDEPSSGAIDFIGTFDNPPKCTVGHPKSREDGTKHMGCAPQLELSLRSGLGSSKKQVSDERPLLNHSDASAFSWYNNSKTLQSLFPTFPSTKSEVASKSHDSQEMSTLVSRQTAQADISLPGPQLGMIGVRSDNICAGYDHSFPSLFVRQSDLTPTWSTKSVCHGAQSSFPVNTSNHSNPEIHHSEQDCHLSDKTTYKSIDQTMHEQNKLERMEESRPGSPATGPSACSSLGNAVGNNIGSGTYGSNCTSNDGDALAVASEITAASESLNGSGRYVHEGLGGADSLRSSQREAALTKFRLKRKDRCFEKKVRYQSRKLLAEQRPRVKGQFVHRAQTDSPTADAAVEL